MPGWTSSAFVDLDTLVDLIQAESGVAVASVMGPAEKGLVCLARHGGCAS